MNERNYSATFLYRSQFVIRKLRATPFERIAEDETIFSRLIQNRENMRLPKDNTNHKFAQIEGTIRSYEN